MASIPLRVLVVDDFAPFRRFVASLVREQQALKIVGEAADGVEAVRKAEELQPDLILLDIGLPRLNGIEAARRIHQLCPQCKILFLSQESSPAVVQAALATGAWGYVVKTDAGSKLLPTITAILREEFAGAPRHALQPPTAARQKAAIRSHEALFYSDDESFVDVFTQFIAAALNTGNAVIVVATEAHRAGLFPRLQAHGLEMGDAIKQGRYIALDAAHTLSTLMVNGTPDPARFLELAGNLISAAAKSAKGEHPRVAVCGECEPPLWKLGTGDAAIQLEQLWNHIAARYEVDILCGYPLSPFQSDQGSDLYASVCAQHSTVYSR